jgi:hypothetical protein
VGAAARVKSEMVREMRWKRSVEGMDTTLRDARVSKIMRDEICQEKGGGMEGIRQTERERAKMITMAEGD